VILVRHAAVTVDPREDAHQWRLSADGEVAATRLANVLQFGAVGQIYSSPEPKAIATACAVARGQAVVEIDGLAELDRRAAGWLGTSDDYAAMVAEIFRQPTVSVRGCETALAAQRRIVGAIDRLAGGARDEAIAVVSHGIVLTLYVSWLRGLAEPDLDRWRRMRFPDAAVVDHERRVVLSDFGEDVSRIRSSTAFFGA
jgi:broad specificity phosphatase PhoE